MRLKKEYTEVLFRKNIFNVSYFFKKYIDIWDIHVGSSVILYLLKTKGYLKTDIFNKSLFHLITWPSNVCILLTKQLNRTNFNFNDNYRSYLNINH